MKLRPWGGISILQVKLGSLKLSLGISSNGPYLTMRPTKSQDTKKKGKGK